MTELDFSIMVNAESQPITLTLPPATGSGQFYRVKKRDDGDEIVTVMRQGTDLIGDSISLNFIDQDGGCLLQDAAPGYWDNIGFFGLDEGVTVQTDVGWWYKPEIGTNAAVASWPTLGNPVNSRLDCVFPDGLRIYLIRPGAADGGDPGHIAPNDFDASFNAVHWEQKT